jgi:hypothetical protein
MQTQQHHVATRQHGWALRAIASLVSRITGAVPHAAGWQAR